MHHPKRICSFCLQFLARARPFSVQRARSVCTGSRPGGRPWGRYPPWGGGPNAGFGSNMRQEKMGAETIRGGGRDHGHKILVRETAVSFESLS